MFRTGIARGVLAASRPARWSAVQSPWIAAPAHNGFHAAMRTRGGFLPEDVAPIISTRPIFPGPVHDLVGDSKMPGRMEGEVGVKAVALRDINSGEVVFREGGEVLSKASMHSIQVGIDRHQTIVGETRFLSHSMNPNCKVVVYDDSSHPIDIVAIQDIPKGADLTFDYNTSEWELGAPFEDCESGQYCAGFRHLGPEERRKRLEAGLLPPHIMQLWLTEVA